MVVFHWDDYNIKILKYVKLNAVRLKLRGTTPPDTTHFTPFGTQRSRHIFVYILHAEYK